MVVQAGWAALGADTPASDDTLVIGEVLGSAITDAVTRESYRDHARALASRVAKEDGVGPVARALERL